MATSSEVCETSSDIVQVPPVIRAEASDTLAPAEASLIAWCTQHGAIWDGIELRRRHGLRGVYATRSFEAGEVVMHVPEEIILTPQRMQE